MPSSEITARRREIFLPKFPLRNSRNRQRQLLKNLYGNRIRRESADGE